MFETEEPVGPNDVVLAQPLLNPTDTFGGRFVTASALLGRYASTDVEAEGAMRLVPLASGEEVVEAGCGPGRFAQALAARGLRVTGIDISPDVVALARETHPGPTYRVLDMAAIPPLSAEAIVNVYSSFGYCATPEGDAATLRTWHRALRPGGRLLMELSDLERAEHRLDRRVPVVRRASGAVEEEIRMDWAEQMLHVTYRFESQAVVCRTRIYSRQQLLDGLARAGFEQVRVFGGFDGRPKNPDDRLVLVARRSR